jgi:hypothetical protein
VVPKFLIDECLSPDLAALARDRGFAESSHVTWLGIHLLLGRRYLQRAPRERGDGFSVEVLDGVVSRALRHCG